jgi:N-methylhydantoinase B
MAASAIDDPFAVEAARSGLIAIAEDMKQAIIRTAYSHILSQAHDFGCAVLDHEGRELASAFGVPNFQGALGFGVRAVLDVHPGDTMRNGEVYLHNDPYEGGGNHLNDVAMIAPVVLDGELAGFVAVKAHWMDVGAVIPGIGPMDGRDVYGEGLRFRAIRVMSEGEYDEWVMRLVTSNLRAESGVMHDLEALAATIRAATERFRVMVERSGLARMRELGQAMCAQSEARSRHAVAAIPDGVYEARASLDNDGVVLDRPLEVVARITVDGSEMTIDLSDSAPQADGPVNCGWASTLAFCRLFFKSVTTPDDPVDDGAFRPLTVVLPRGLFISAQEPAPVAKYAQSGTLLVEVCLRALSEALPTNIPAGGHGDNMSHPMYGREPNTGKLYMFAESHVGGGGAFGDRDGESAIFIAGAATHRNVPVEMVEARHPQVQLLEYSLRRDSGGPGRHRGGLGIVRRWRFLGDVHGTFSLERSVCPPWGADGGESGATNRLLVHKPDGTTEETRKASGLRIEAGSVVEACTGGGGGYGEPYERPVDQVRADVRNGYVSPADAVRYGVVFDERTGEYDEAATWRLRGREEGDQ